MSSLELAFNVPGAGPLAQISVEVLRIETAVFLASGAIGWWKARERSLSLAESLSVNKVALVSTSSFNYAQYQSVRKSGTVRGLAVQGGVLRRLYTGVESTAVLNNSGVDCLRALATGLLCFYDVALTSMILADIIPYGLLQKEQEDHMPEFAGPLFASLSDWVKAVAAEEDCNNFRQHLLQGASQSAKDMTGLQFSRPTVENEYDELGLLLGCLRWMVTPEHRRDTLKYPTRSIRVWATAAVMSKLGFSISISHQPVQTKDQYRLLVTPPHDDDLPDLVLVAASIGHTDPLIITTSTTASLELRPQIMPLLSVPQAAFGRLQKQYTLLDPSELTDIWQMSFRYAKSAVGLPTLSRGGKVHLMSKSKDNDEVFRECHKNLIGLWSPHLARILRRAFDDYVPKTLDECWSPRAIQEFFDRKSSGEMIVFEQPDLVCNVYKLTAIMLGTIYGACSVALRAQVSDEDGGQALGDEAIEIAFSPDIIASNKLQEWASTLGMALSGLLDHSGWVGLLLELVTGIKHPQPLDEQPTAGILGKQLNVIGDGAFKKSHLRVSDVLGAQANGVFAISEFVVRPSTDAASCLRFHVGIGRILDISIDRSGYVRSSQADIPASELHLDPEPNIDLLSLQHNQETIPALRIDAEPHWLSDPQTVCFAVRKAGTVIATLNISKLLEKLMNCTVECDCASPSHQLNVPVRERWQHVSIHQLVRADASGQSRGSVFIQDRDRILIHVGGDEACRAFVVGSVSCRKTTICRDCVLCAYEKAKPRNSNVVSGGTTLIVG